MSATRPILPSELNWKLRQMFGKFTRFTNSFDGKKLSFVATDAQNVAQESSSGAQSSGARNSNCRSGKIYRSLSKDRVTAFTLITVCLRFSQLKDGADNVTISNEVNEVSDTRLRGGYLYQVWFFSTHPYRTF